MKLRLRAAAVHDLDGIFDYSFAMHGAAVTERYIRALYAGMERLCEFPEAGVARDIKPGLRSLSVHNHLVFYRIERGEVIVVVRVLHKAMDLGRHL